LGAAELGQEIIQGVRDWIAQVNSAFWRSFQVDLHAVSSKSKLVTRAEVRLQGGGKSEI